MRIISNIESLLISGAEKTMLATYQVNCEGVSQFCIDTLLDSVKAPISEKQFMLNMLNACEIKELDLLFDSDAADHFIAVKLI